MSDFPKSILIQEVSPRDGLQIEPKILSTDEKLRLIAALVAAGCREIEAGSFVNPQAVPQMGDAAELFPRLPRHEGVKYHCLVLNVKGIERALATPGADLEGKLSMTASETFIKRNTNRSIEEAFAEMPRWISAYRAGGLRTRSLAVMAAFGCNFEGDVPVEDVIGLIARTTAIMSENGETLEHVRLADTMGWANPEHIRRMIGSVRERWPELDIRLHLHDTRGLAIANIFVALEMGVADFDASVGGLGGCPFASLKGAAGNVSTEDLVFLCDELGIETGINLEAIIEASRLAAELVGHPLPGKLAQAGPPRRSRS